MRSPKQEALALLDRLPDDVSMETILQHLLFHAEILRALEEAERGEVVSREEAKKRIARWLHAPDSRSHHPT